MTGPKRIQRRRTKGWRMPEDAVYVGRPSRWSNPAVVERDPSGGYAVVISLAVVNGVSAKLRFAWTTSKAAAVEEAVYWFSAGLDRSIREGAIDVAVLRSALGDRDLACWCALEDAEGNRVPCHADVLLEIANPGWKP